MFIFIIFQSLFENQFFPVLIFLPFTQFIFRRSFSFLFSQPSLILACSCVHFYSFSTAFLRFCSYLCCFVTYCFFIPLRYVYINFSALTFFSFFCQNLLESSSNLHYFFLLFSRFWDLFILRCSFPPVSFRGPVFFFFFFFVQSVSTNTFGSPALSCVWSVSKALLEDLFFPL